MPMRVSCGLSTRPDYETITPRVRIVDLFAGGGGLSLGMAEAARRRARYRVVLAVEQRSDAAQVFSRNFPRARVLEADVATLFDGAVGSSPTDERGTTPSAGRERGRAARGTAVPGTLGPEQPHETQRPPQ